jgi:hypothetical protein
MNSKERQFSTETNFERTTDKFRKNVIRSNDLARLISLGYCDKFYSGLNHSEAFNIFKLEGRSLSLFVFVLSINLFQFDKLNTFDK